MFPHFSKRLRTWPKLGLLINRNYTLLWLGGTISVIGDVLFTMMLILWVGTLLQNQSAAPLAVSGVALAAALPALLIGPFAGVFVDRWPKQRTMRIMDALRAVLVCSLLPISGPLPLPLAVRLTIMYLVVAAVSGLSQFFTPATKAILKEVVPEEQLTRASQLSVGAGMFSWAIGSACAGICYVSLGAGWAIALNAASFACSWVLVGRMRVSAKDRRASAQTHIPATRLDRTARGVAIHRGPTPAPHASADPEPVFLWMGHCERPGLLLHHPEYPCAREPVWPLQRCASHWRHLGDLAR